MNQASCAIRKNKIKSEWHNSPKLCHPQEENQIQMVKSHKKQIITQKEDNEYCKNALDKIGLYSANDICIGEKLIVTFESSAKGIDMKQVEKYIDKYLI